jgi:hypothetical protein
MVGRLAFAAGLLVCVSAPSARAAAGTRIDIRYDAPEACPDDARLVAGVEHFLGQPLRDAREQALAVKVTVMATPEGFAARLVFHGPRGVEERSAEDMDCDRLAEASALLVALAIDPERVNAQRLAAETPPPLPVGPAPAPPEPTQASPAPLAQTAAPCPPVLLPPPRKERRLVAGLSALVSVGVMPRVSPGIGIDFGARFGRAQLELVGSYWFSATAEVAGPDPASIEISLALAGLRGCGVIPQAGWSMLACAQGQVGDMSGSGQQVDAARTRHAWVADLQGLLMARYEQTELKPWLGLGLSWQVRRPAFGLASQSPAEAPFRPSVIALVGQVGVALGP